ncbi:hypothetical protein PG996_007534 [Apiospora saccharicola]|uniref:Uncharacterized protein n=1 Tax=Apiospora saccharicola TaxID=335842 RepID=A0ABR1VC03_9PEZI
MAQLRRRVDMEVERALAQAEMRANQQLGFAEILAEQERRDVEMLAEWERAEAQAKVWTKIVPGLLCLAGWKVLPSSRVASSWGLGRLDGYLAFSATCLWSV